MNNFPSSLTPFLVTLTLWTCPSLHSQEAAPPQARTSGAEAATAKEMVKELNSAASALFDLAGERFAANEKRHAVWIMTLHDASKSLEVLKYTDGRITVVALPVVVPDGELGLRRYVNAYNAYNVKSADLKVKAGRYKEARELYSLLLHFDPQGALAEGVRRRLAHLEKLEKGDDVQKNLKELMDLFTDLSPSLLAGIEDVRPTPATNLLEVSFH